MGRHTLYTSKDQNCIQESFHNKRLVARDVIQQTIRDIQNLEKFIIAIPRLKSFQKTMEQLPELKDCVAGLVGHITVACQTLSRIRQLNDNVMHHVLSNSKLLRNVMSEAVQLQGQVCHNALKYVIRTITSMLSRKLLNVVVTIDDILYLVDQLQVKSHDPTSAIAKS
ncbi:hypothetical protein AgCh_024000 [Apium graveolens]